MNTENWEWFKVGDLFTEIYKAKAHIKQEVNITNDKSKGLIFVSRTETNNGCDVLIERDDRVIIEARNAIIIGDTTATCFYQEKEFTTGDHIIVCRSNWLNKYTALFFKTIMDNEKYRFNYGRAFKMELVKEHKIKLPAATNMKGDIVPDWQWMEDYAKNTLLPQLPLKARQVWEKRYNNQPLSAQKLELKVEEWKWFKATSIFDMYAGKYYATDEYETGETPLVSSSETNNGIMKFTNLQAVFPGNCITIGKVGMSNFYQPYPFCASPDVTVLMPKLDINQYQMLFIKTVLDLDKYRWCYGNQIRLNDSQTIKIKLPAITNENGETVPDWQWMEDYIKGLPYSGAL